jgi:hypothetical protein
MRTNGERTHRSASRPGHFAFKESALGWVGPRRDEEAVQERKILTGMIPTGKHWHSAESQLADVRPSKRAWKATGGRSRSGVDHGRKSRSGEQRTDIGRHFCVNRAIQLWNQLPADALGTLACKPSSFSKAINQVKWNVGGNHQEMRWSEVKWSEVTLGKWSKLWWESEGYVDVVTGNKRQVKVKSECNSSWKHAFHYSYSLVYNMLNSILSAVFLC